MGIEATHTTKRIEEGEKAFIDKRRRIPSKGDGAAQYRKTGQGRFERRKPGRAS